MAIEACVVLKSVRELIQQRDRLKELADHARAVASNIDWTVNGLAEIAEKGSDRSAESLLAEAAPDMADAIVETLEWMLTDFGNRQEWKRCADLLQNALSKATGTNQHKPREGVK